MLTINIREHLYYRNTSIEQIKRYEQVFNVMIDSFIDVFHSLKSLLEDATL